MHTFLKNNENCTLRCKKKKTVIRIISIKFSTLIFMKFIVKLILLENLIEIYFSGQLQPSLVIQGHQVKFLFCSKHLKKKNIKPKKAQI